MATEVRIVRLITGEELIGTVLADTESGVILQYPLALAMQQDQQTGQARLIFAPFMPYSNAGEEITIPRASLLLEPIAPSPQIANDYGQVTAQIHNKVFVPEKQIIFPVK